MQEANTGPTLQQHPNKVLKSKTEAATLARGSQRRRSRHSCGFDVQVADTGLTLHRTHDAHS